MYQLQYFLVAHDRISLPKLLVSVVDQLRLPLHEAYHLIIFLVVIIDFQEPPLVPKYLIKSGLFINVTHIELYEHPVLTLKNDRIDQL